MEMAKTQKGQPYKKCQLEDGRNINFFKFYTIYDHIKVGFDVPDKEIVMDGEYWSWQDPSTKPKTKEQSIERFQTNKEKSIMLASTMRMAVDITTATVDNSWTEEDIKSKIQAWRSWLILEWDNDTVENTEPF